jgi:hypothetical protein
MVEDPIQTQLVDKSSLKRLHSIHILGRVHALGSAGHFGLGQRVCRNSIGSAFRRRHGARFASFQLEARVFAPPELGGRPSA